MKNREFFIQDVDLPSGIVISEVSCGVLPVRKIARLLDIEEGEIRGNHVHPININDIDKINNLIGLNINRSVNEPHLASWSASDGLSYRSHTRRELILMASGDKPLSVLHGSIPSDESFEEIPEYLFEPYVSRGLFTKSEYYQPTSSFHPDINGLRYVLYALAGEEWRINAYILLRSVGKKAGWNESLTRFEGSLLGYTDQQNDEYIALVRERGGF